MKIYKSWNEFNSNVRIDRNANIFYSEAYEKFEKLRENRCIYVGNNDAVLLVVIWRKYIFHWGILPSEPYYYNQSCRNEVYEREFLDDVMDTIKPSVISWIGCTGTAANFCAYPTNSIRIPFGNYIIDLAGKDDLFSNVTSKCRNMIRKAEKDGVEIISGGEELLNDYMEIDKKTWERSGIQKNTRKEYERYLSALKYNSCIYLAKKENELQGGAIFLYNSAMSYYLFGASITKPSPGSLNLLQYRALMDFKNSGVKYHNLVGCRINEDIDSKYHGIQKFKSSFGGDLIQGYMFKDRADTFIHKVFIRAYKIKNRSVNMSEDIIDQEIHKWMVLNED